MLYLLFLLFFFQLFLINLLKKNVTEKTLLSKSVRITTRGNFVCIEKYFVIIHSTKLRLRGNCYKLY